MAMRSTRALRSVCFSALMLGVLGAANAQEIVRQPLAPPSVPQTTAEGSTDAQPQAKNPSTQSEAPWDIRSGDAASVPADPAPSQAQSPFAATAPEAAAGETAGVKIDLEQHLDRVESAIEERAVVDPRLADKAENMQWDDDDVGLVEGDFAAPNDASSKVGWVAPGKKSDAPKIRRPRINIDSMTKLRLTEQGSTYLDLKRGQVVHRW